MVMAAFRCSLAVKKWLLPASAKSEAFQRAQHMQRPFRAIRGRPVNELLVDTARLNEVKEGGARRAQEPGTGD